MRKIISIIFFLLFATHSYVKAQNELVSLKQEISALQTKQKSLERNVLELTSKNKVLNSQIRDIKLCNDSLLFRVDSLENVCKDISNVQKADRDTLSNQIGSTRDEVQGNLSNRTSWGIGIVVALFVIIVVLVWLFFRKFKNGSSTIEEVRKAQDSLGKAQTKIQEESVKLDNKLLEIAEQQLSMQKANETNAKAPVDHSLTLKVADELTKIEMNLSRMDSSVKGYKQLSKAVQRIKDNFTANGYEIVDMLGKPYNEGMKVVANFVPDETLEEGKQIITGIIKPQINFRGIMIQSAQITVSQNI